MQLEKKKIEQAAQASGISVEDVTAFFAEGEERRYAANEWLFHESTPRLWAGILLEGEVEIVRGLHGSSQSHCHYVGRFADQRGAVPR